jgi:hypothetical protein
MPLVMLEFKLVHDFLDFLTTFLLLSWNPFEYIVNCRHRLFVYKPRRASSKSSINFHQFKVFSSKNNQKTTIFKMQKFILTVFVLFLVQLISFAYAGSDTFFESSSSMEIPSSPSFYSEPPLGVTPTQGC